MSLYLDYNASTPIDERVLDIMVRIYKGYYGNADSRTHPHGQKARQVVEEARKQVAGMLGIENHEVIFTSGATESDNLAILGLEAYGLQTSKKHIITSSIEHKAVLEAVKYLSQKGFDVEFISPDISGYIKAQELLSKVRSDTLLVSLQHVNNETGIIQPVEEIGKALSHSDTLFHIDAVQSCGKLVDEIKGLYYDMLSLSAHKMYGPQGIGALILRRKSFKAPPIQPRSLGGGHENGYRAGTLPVALIAGFGEACKIAQSEYSENDIVYRENKKAILEMIQQSGVDYDLNGNQAYCIDTTLNVSFTGIDSEALMIAAKQECSISNGSACTSHDYSPSYVLTAMGLPPDRISSAIRLSWGKTKIDKNMVARLLEKVKTLQ